MSQFVAVAKVDEIPPGKGRAFEVGEHVIAVFNDNGEYFAINDMCPHMGASLADGCLQGSAVVCPWHAWSFDVRDGSWCDNRRLKTETFEVRVVDSSIEVATEPAPKPDDDVKL